MVPPEPLTFRSNHALPPCGASPNYFEVSIERCDSPSEKDVCCVAIGVCDEFTRFADALPGWRGMSWGYHGDNGQYFSSKEDGLGGFGGKFGKGDKIGCQVDWERDEIQFYLNEKRVGTYMI